MKPIAHYHQILCAAKTMFCIDIHFYCKNSTQIDFCNKKNNGLKNTLNT
ncbi:hypothetical protein GCHA_3259 [Paraglaciecola chathamensis S18K6]|uniref:Uncharacterized protein n=1 Tax=Paraglaciecola chathamensis S18K6 TaxID=1127672 RepID=A0AAV3V2P2_9ALTE|nr:hypothetical protein GCHA_3259 [Paraglaciecola chathamensis S18K6]